MTHVTDRYGAGGPGGPLVMCDFTPPRSGDPAVLDRLKGVSADFFCAAYNPGKLVRADSVAAAHAVRERTGVETVFNLATRDMNKIALQSRLLGAQMLGLENVIVMHGDELTERELGLGVTSVRDYSSTSLIAALRAMNDGQDYRGAALTAPTDFCIGATLDLARDLAAEAALTKRKAEAGAHYFITQPIYAPEERERFLALYEEAAGGPLAVPVLWGVQVLDKDGVIFGNVPAGLRAQLDAGRDGAEAAGELLAALVEAGVRGFYLIPPILKGGRRDYEAAQRVLGAIGR